MVKLVIEIKKPTRETAARFRDEITPKIWDTAGRVSIDSIVGAYEIIYSFVKFWLYPFVKAAIKFYNEILVPFWGHVKVFWARFVNKMKNVNWKFWTWNWKFWTWFRKKDEPVVEEPVIVEDPLF